MANLDEASRCGWSAPNEGKPNTEQLKLGCLQRIANAQEEMAKGWIELREDRDRKDRYWKEEVERRRGLERQVSALRGVITKLKRKAK